MQKAWQAWTFVDFGPKRSVQDGRPEGGGRGDGLRLRGVWRSSGVRFLPAEGAGGYETVAGAYFRCHGACTQNDPKVILGAKTLTLEPDEV